MEQGRDTHDTAWVPLITGIEEPFKKILEAAKLSLEGEIALEGARKALEACAAIAEVQERNVGEYTGPEDVDPEEVIRKTKESQVALGDDRLIPPKGPFAELLYELLIALGEDEERLTGFVDKIAQSVGMGKIFIGGLHISPENLAEVLIEEQGIDQGRLLAALMAAWQTFVVAEAEVIRPHIVRETWNLSTCPICGSHPEMSRIEATEGHLYLVCPLCLTEWKHPRLKCPWCGNENQNTLGFFMAEEYPGYRVNICRDCSGYLKVTVEKTMNRRHVPTVDNLLTLELDLQAEREGFKRPEE